jgi:hypothetical protein
MCLSCSSRHLFLMTTIHVRHNYAHFIDTEIGHTEESGLVISTLPDISALGPGKYTPALVPEVTFLSFLPFKSNYSLLWPCPHSHPQHLYTHTLSPFHLCILRVNCGSRQEFINTVFVTFTVLLPLKEQHILAFPEHSTVPSVQ